MFRQDYWKDSRGRVSVVLLVLWLATLLHGFRFEFFLRPFVAVFLAIVLDSLIRLRGESEVYQTSSSREDPASAGFQLWVTKVLCDSSQRIRGLSALGASITRWRYGIRFFSLSSVVTGLLIGLVFNPESTWISLLAASAIAVLSKQWLGKGRHRHIFNPAALGILVSSIVFNQPVAWWGAAWGMTPVLILAIGMTPILWKLQRFWMPITFLAVYFISNLFNSNVEAALRLTFDGTAFLFALVMLPEPATAPLQGKWRYGWGMFVGLMVIIQSLLKIGDSDPLLLSLLVGNFVGYFLSQRLIASTS